MLYSRLATCFTSLLLGAHLTNGLSIPFRREIPSVSKSISIRRRRSGADSVDQFNFTFLSQGDNMAIYVGTIHLAGQSLDVQLDTGSSDLWIDTDGIDISQFVDTSAETAITYGDGTSAIGPILAGQVTFGNLAVDDQAFISAPKSNATSLGDKGLLGIGPPSLSRIKDTLVGSDHNGKSFLDNVFSKHPEDPNFITFSLARSPLGMADGGVFAIGEIPAEFSQIEKSTVLPVDSDAKHWITSLDSVKINNVPMSGHGFRTKETALLDSGSSLAEGPRAYIDAMYGSIPGAAFDDNLATYRVPCDANVQMEFVFGGASFPVHPIDATYAAGIDEDSNQVVCAGAFSVIEPNSEYDWLLGDSFLRNVFSLYEFGSWTSVADSPPHVKLLSVTDTSRANSEFEAMNAARLEQARARGN
ncbi:hypothetical protein HGRIS_011108 [Hohenbuehelia grisea]|uniref:Peptidase A1 domain-containing protein n=1 Tax=Hohenbuehelia grisea TaxID=104357 RepID=A0ABR3IZ41_9AGAR